MNKQISELAKLIRYYILTMSTKAGSGHPTSSLSAADLMAVLFAEFYHFDFDDKDNPGNDKLIFSKGHATPLYYSLFALSGAITTKDLDNYRKFCSPLEGHATPRFQFTEAATGSLGQGLSIGVGIALALRAQLTTHNSQPHVYVLLGDGEMAEGSVWEAMEIASKYKLGNLVGIIDVNRRGQTGETMLGHDVAVYEKRVASFGWKTKVIDGHDYGEIAEAFREIQDKPYMIIAKTIKGKGVSFLEDKPGWHGKPLPPDLLNKALSELGHVDLDLRVKVHEPPRREISNFKFKISNKFQNPNYKIGDEIATRKAYGTALAKYGEIFPEIVALDGEVSNSTYSEIFRERFPERFFEMFIAEQNMVGVAVGLSKMGKIPFVSSFGAFLTRAYDQVRMAAISQANIKFCGSHAGVSIGEDGPSQMALEDISMFRSIFGSVVLYPSDAVATEKLVLQMINHKGICYMRTNRPATPVIYDTNEEFPIGGSKVHRTNNIKQRTKNKKIILVAAGITLFEALKAQEELANEGIEAVVVDCYSVKPIDEKTLKDLIIKPTTYNLQPTTKIITVEDHWSEGGLGDAVLNVFSSEDKVKIYKMAVTKMPRSGKPQELLDFEEISAKSIISKVKEIIS